MTEGLVLGVDIGGTKVAAGLVDGSGKVVRSAREPIKVTGTAIEALECVHHAIQKVLPTDGVRVTAIGISSPGPLDQGSGIILHSPNLPCWRQFPLRQQIESAYDLPTRLENDANAAGLAEAVWGAGTGRTSVLYVTIGTGIGTAIILEKRVYDGRTGAAAEGGHMTIDLRGEINCGCGKRGCIEGLAAGPAIAALSKSKIQAGPARGDRIVQIAGGIEKISAEAVLKAAREQDGLAREIMDEISEYLAVWLGNMIDILEPDVIVIGGGVGSRMTEWFEHIRDRAGAWSVNPRAREISIMPAGYGENSGIAGAAALWLYDPAANMAISGGIEKH